MQHKMNRNAAFINKSNGHSYTWFKKENLQTSHFKFIWNMCVKANYFHEKNPKHFRVVTPDKRFYVILAISPRDSNSDVTDLIGTNFIPGLLQICIESH